MIENRADQHRTYRFELASTPGGTLSSPLPEWEAEPHHAFEVPLFVELPRIAFTGGEARAHIRITNDAGFERVIDVTLFGPDTGGR